MKRLVKHLILLAAGATGAAIGWVWAGRAPVGWYRAGEPENDEDLAYVSERWS